jgi:DNA-binding response OmpR family regulator
MGQVLVVERREPPRAADELVREGFVVLTAMHSREALTVCEGMRPDVVVVEGVAAHAAVRALCAELRSATSSPLVLLSPPCSEPDAVAAFGAGVDTLILEPVGSHELIARIRALLRRVPPPSVLDSDVIVIGPVVLDTARRELFVGGEQVRTPRREFDIAVLLMRDAGRVVSRQSIVRELWGSVRDTKSLDVQVGRLRARLASAEGRRRIVTVRGVGYRFLTDDDPLIDAFSAAVVATPDASPVIDLCLEIARDDRAEFECRDPDLLEGSASA